MGYERHLQPGPEKEHTVRQVVEGRVASKNPYQADGYSREQALSLSLT